MAFAVTAMAAFFPLSRAASRRSLFSVGRVPATIETTPAPAAAETLKCPPASKFLSTAPKIEIQNFRPFDKRGINVYESPKEEGAAYTGFKLSWGAAIHAAVPGTRSQQHGRAENGRQRRTDANKLIQIGHGFNNAEANLNLNAQLARGIRVALTQYLSTRHHNETWVKDGYFLIDGSPIDNAMLDNLMKFVTLRVGHFEINYGDAHFRRTDGGNAIYNPLVGNYIMDAFTTEIGAEAYLRKNGSWRWVE